MSIRAPLLLLASFALAACSSTATGAGSGMTDPGNGNASGGSGSGAPASSEFDPLFQTPDPAAKVTPDSIYGLWALTGSSYADGRLQIGKTSFTKATRCNEGSSSETVGVTASARISSSSIELLESKNASGQRGCAVGVKVSQLTTCSPGYTYNCFSLQANQLSLYDDSGSAGNYLKLTD